MNAAQIKEARSLVTELNREYRRKSRNDKIMDQIIKDVREMVGGDGVLYKTRYDWRLKLWSGSERDKKEGRQRFLTWWVEGKPHSGYQDVPEFTPQQPRRSTRERIRPSVRATGRGYRHQHSNKKHVHRLSRPITHSPIGQRQFGLGRERRG